MGNRFFEDNKRIYDTYGTIRRSLVDREKADLRNYQSHDNYFYPGQTDATPKYEDE